MTYFLLQSRSLRPLDQRPPSFPATLTARITFGPEDAFGIAGGEGRTTAKRATEARFLWNANEGTSQWQGELIDSLNAEYRRGRINAAWRGNHLELTMPVNSIDEAQQLLTSFNQSIPAFLSLRFRVFIWIREYLIDIGGCRFRLETSGHRYGITISTTKHNEEAAIQSIRDCLAVRQESVRIVMALYYYRQALRLCRLEPDRQSMASEVVLNLAKAIEIVFSSSRDRLRSRASEWGLDANFIERWIIPILLIRNELDVAHVATAPLTTAQHQSILDFLDRAFAHVDTLLTLLLEKSQSGEVILDPPSTTMETDKERLLRKITEYARSP